MSKDKLPTQAKASNEQIVLGQQLADAHRADAKWSNSGGGLNSPLPARRYDFWVGDLSLINPPQNQLDDEIRSVCRHYSLLGADERYTIRQSISMEQFYILMDFAKRSALFGIRNSKREFIVDGLTAIAMIEQERVDFRDILCCLGLLNHAALKVSGNPGEMFCSAAALAETEVAGLLVGFTKQSPEYQSLRDSWGYDEVETDNGVGFIGWGFRNYDPSVDLKMLAIEISKVLDSDSYRTSQVEVATELPEVWFGSQQNPETVRILSNIRAGATVSASLRPDKHVEHQSQQFTVFLAETANASDAQQLCHVSEANSSTNYSKLAFACSNLFCLVVARSFVLDKEAYENNTSLKRFKDELSSVLVRFAGVEEEKK